jgi:hypothetical protein
MLDRPLTPEEEEARGHDLLKIIAKGMDAQVFLQGELGLDLLRRAEVDAQAFLEQMAELDVDTEYGRKKHRDLKVQIGVCEQLFVYLNRVVQEGKDAEAEYQEGESLPGDALDPN